MSESVLFPMLPTRDRDARGRFLPGNQTASLGGRRRAQQLPAAQRQAIATQGRAAMVRRHFLGRDDLQRRYFAQLGVYQYDLAAGAYAPHSPLRPISCDPGPIPDWLAAQFTLELWTAFTLADVPELEF